MSTDEDGVPVQLGAGSFATTYVIGGRLIASTKASYIANAEKPGEEDAEFVTTSTIIIVKLPSHFSRFGFHRPCTAQILLLRPGHPLLVDLRCPPTRRS